MMNAIRARTSALSADVRILVAALAALVILAVLMLVTASPPPAPTLSDRNDQPDGALALQLWLSRSGYRVSEVLSLADELNGVRVLLVLEPQLMSQDDARLIHDWVQRGNTLIVAGMPFDGANTLLDTFQVSLDYSPSTSGILARAGPVLLSPPFDTVDVGYAYEVNTPRTDVVTYLVNGGIPALVSFNEGAGTVWVSGAILPFTNLGVQDPNDAALVANLFADVPWTAAIGFDEAAHGFNDSAQTISGWLTGTAPGWGILSALALTMLYLMLRGRRFGHAVPLPDDRLRREPVEYIQAMATLFRKSGDRAEILRHYNGQLRRRLSERYALDPRLNNDDLVKMAVYRNPAINEAALRDLLARLSRQKISEAELLTLVSDIDQWLRSMT